MTKRCLIPSLAICLSLATTLAAQEAKKEEKKVFSGPQVGEKIVSFKMIGVYDKLSGKTIDIVKQADGKPILIVFVHKLTRPSIGLARVVMNYAKKRSSKGLVSVMVFLSDDRAATERRLLQIRRALPAGGTIGVSPDGLDGPGAYGLNRDVTLTVIVGKKNKVTGNFALVQPSVQSDTMKIVKQIVAVTGGGKVPKLAELIPQRRRGMRMRRLNKDQLATLGRLAFNIMLEDNSKEEIQAAANQVDQFLRRFRAPARVSMAKLAKEMRLNKRFATFPADVKRKITVWSNFKIRGRNLNGVDRRLTEQIGPYIRPVINRMATPMEVAAAAKKLEKFIANKPKLQKHLGVICNRVKDLGYGTPPAQKLIRQWAAKYGAPPKKKNGQKKKKMS